MTEWFYMYFFYKKILYALPSRCTLIILSIKDYTSLILID